MASLHRETRFCTFDAEKSPYLCDKILADPEGNVVIPTLLLVKEGKVTYHIRGLAELGGEQCNCEIMAAVLQIHGLIKGEAAKHGARFTASRPSGPSRSTGPTRCGRRLL